MVRDESSARLNRIVLSLVPMKITKVQALGATAYYANARARKLAAPRVVVWRSLPISRTRKK